MGIRFLLGRSGTGKSSWIRDDIKQNVLTEPRGAPIFYIVPDQMSFQQERALFHQEDLQGSIRAQVVSFSRLAWRVLQETGGGTKPFISSVGVQMMLRKIMEESRDDWLVFQKAMDKQGFLAQLEAVVTEFKRYRITPEMLRRQTHKMDRFVHKHVEETALIHKLYDLTRIYERLIQALQHKYIDREDQLQLLGEKVRESSLLDGADIYIDGFHHLSPQELFVIEELMKRCRRITIALTLDELANGEPSELDLFYQTKETYHNVRALARENGIAIEGNIVLDSTNGRFQNRPAFCHLEHYFDVRPAPAFSGDVPMTIAEAVHPRAEVEGAAQEIIRLVRDENYRFRDIAVFIRETEVYHDLIETIFNDYAIPVFIDEKRPMHHHPLIELIRSALEVVEGNWRYDAIFRVLKTGFIPPTDSAYPLTDDAIDELENYVLEYGIRSRNRWLGDEEWVFQRFRGFADTAQTDTEKQIQQRINAYRRQVAKALGDFDRQIRQATTVREHCEQVYLLLEHLDVPNRLEAMRAFYDEKGQIEKGREQEQVWNAVVQLLDEMVEITGEESIGLSTFRTMLEAGFDALTYAHVPPTLDHVIVGTVDRSRVSDVKCAFLLGVNEGVWPMKPPADGVINERERELLAEAGLQLAESTERRLLDDRFNMYTVFTSASDRLWVSYPLSDEEGRAKTPSPLIKRIEDLFPQTKNHLLLQDPDELLEADRFITTPAKTRGALTAQLARYLKGYPIKDVWWHVLNWYITNQPKHDTTHTIVQSLYYENKPKNLSKQTTAQLYPKEIQASVSRLESYYSCSYQHFAKYSLGLEERKIYKLDAPDIGQLFHEALKKITETIQKEGKDFSQLNAHETSDYAAKAMADLAPILQHQILHSSNRYRYIQKKLQEVIARATYILSEQARRSKFSPVGLELGFGPSKKDTLPPLRLPLNNGFELMLRGRIDRVDKAEDGDDLFLRIIDYKSSAIGLNLVEVYYGIALQMLAYLDVVLMYSEQWLGTQATPAGVLYFHVHNPMISGKEQLQDEQLAEEIFKKYKMQGLLLSDEEIIRMMDTSLDAGSSRIVPAGIKKNGGFYRHSKIADNNTFTALRTHVHHLIKQAGIDITSGGINLNPYWHNQNTPCSFCPFLSVCQFDPTLPDNQYRKLAPLKDDEVVERLKKERGM